MEVISQLGLLTVTVSTPQAAVSQVGVITVTQGLPKAAVSQVGLLVVSSRIGKSDYLCVCNTPGVFPADYLAS